MAKALSAQPDLMRGLVRLAVAGAPAGAGTITRRTGRQVDTIRGGLFTFSTGGVIIADAEAHFGTELTYRVVDTPTDRYIQSNRVLNPKAAVNVANATTGPNRTLTRETGAPLPPRDAITSFKVGPYPGQTTWETIEDRLILSLLPSGFGPGRWYVSGQLRYDSPDIWLWDDVKTAGTWQTIKNKGTWQDVKAANSPLAGQPFASLFATVIGPAKTSQLRRANLVPNPQNATATTGWFVLAGTGGTAAITRVATGGPTNGPFARMTYTVANTSPAGTGSGASVVVDGRSTSGLPIPVAPGAICSGSIDVKSSIAQLLDCRIQWYDASNVALAGAAAQTAGTAQVVAANTWTRLSVAGAVAPAGAAYARVVAYAPTGTGAVPYPIGATLDATRAMLEYAAATPGPYFDGALAASAPMTYAWSGTANASASTETVLDYPTSVVPFQILGVETGDNGGWATFQGIVDVPVGTPANSRLAFLSGTVTREATVTWWLSTLMVSPEAESLKPGAILPYFDGDSSMTAIANVMDPGDRLAPGYDWRALSGDAAVSWSGTPNGSWSQFTGPSQIFADTTTYLGRPDRTLLPNVKQPVFLSDPVAPQLAQWFELVEIGDLTFAGRQQLFDVLGRGAAIAVNQKRGWAAGELRLMTYTLAQADIAERLFESGRILYWRNPDPRYPENGWWVAIGDVAQGRVGAQASFLPQRLWSVPFARVERPEGLINASSSITWSTLKTNYTWQELRDAKRDWLEAAIS